MRKLKNEELNRPSIHEFKDLKKLPIVVVLDNIRSLNNIGSIFRTADAFRVEGIHLCGITGTPPHREIQKTALGATESLEWSYYKSTLDSVRELQAKGYKIIAIEQMDTSVDLEMFLLNSTDKIALIFGNEIHGVSDDIIDSIDIAVEIPQFGTKHSFNVSISCGIVLWHIYLQGRLS
jgi:tRNA G18 (ribose-2'-O)-methylase SpoU